MSAGRTHVGNTAVVTEDLGRLRGATGRARHVRSRPVRRAHHGHSHPAGRVLDRIEDARRHPTCPPHRTSAPSPSGRPILPRDDAQVSGDSPLVSPDSSVLRAARPGQGDAGHPRGVCGGILTGHRTVRRVRRTRRQEHRPWPAGRVEPASPELAAVHRPMPPYGRQRPCERGPQDARPRTGSHGNGAWGWRMGTARGDGATVTGRRRAGAGPGRNQVPGPPSRGRGQGRRKRRSRLPDKGDGIVVVWS